MRLADALLSHPAIPGQRRPGRFDRVGHARLRRAAPALVASALGTPGSAWRVAGFAFTGTSVAVVRVVAADGPGTDGYVVKVPYLADGAASLRRQVATLRALDADHRLGALARVLPRPIGEGRVGGRPYWVERLLPGTPVTRDTLGGPDGAALLRHATSLATDLHAGTAHRTEVGAGLLASWVDGPVRRLRAHYAARAGGDRWSGHLDRLHAQLTRDLHGRSVHVGWIHGDLWPGNLLARGPEVVGVVDWDQAEPDQPGLHDLLHLHLFARRMATGRELGDLVAEILRVGIAPTLSVPPAAVAGWTDGLPGHTAALLYWVRHVSLFVGSPGHGDNRRWLDRNVERVLDAADGPVSSPLSRVIGG